jgi:hypothetical protein
VWGGEDEGAHVAGVRRYEEASRELRKEMGKIRLFFIFVFFILSSILRVFSVFLGALLPLHLLSFNVCVMP